MTDMMLEVQYYLHIINASYTPLLTLLTSASVLVSR